MAELLNPEILRDFRRGRVAKDVVGQFLVPENSVAECLNVVFDEQIGGAKVRKGTTIISQPVYDVAEGQNSQTGNDTAAQMYDTNWFAQTFTPTAPQGAVVGFRAKLIRTGDAQGFIDAELRGTTAGVPNATVYAYTRIDGATVGTGASAFYDFIFPAEFIDANGSNIFSLVLSYPGGDMTHYITWIKDTAGAYAGGLAYSSVNSGVAFSAIAANDFQFIVYYGLETYDDEEPLGFFVGSVNDVPQSIAIFRDPQVNKGVLFYRDPATGLYETSDVQTLSPTARNRIAILNKVMFRANATDAMQNSVAGTDGQEWATTNSITTDSVIPSLLYVFKNTMLASGYSAFASRIYFSSVVDPNASPFITWDTDPDDGNWIDVNPDDGGSITGFSDASGFVLVFKNNALYRTDTISKIVDLDNIYNIGAPSQEAIVKCLGLTYFYSGQGIYRTDGGFPQEISRIGVSDFLAQIEDPKGVFLETDGLNVYVSMENVRVNGIDYLNLTLKFSPRDESWSVHSYQQRFGVGQLLSDLDEDLVFVPLIQTWAGQILQINDGVGDIKSASDADDGFAVPYFLQTQELEMRDRSHTKQIGDKVVIFTKQGGGGSFLVRSNDGDFVSTDTTLQERVNIATNTVNFYGNYFTFRWQGESQAFRPLLEGFQLPKITDLGVVDEQQS